MQPSLCTNERVLDRPDGCAGWHCTDGCAELMARHADLYAVVLAELCCRRAGMCRVLNEAVEPPAA